MLKLVEFLILKYLPDQRKILLIRPDVDSKYLFEIHSNTYCETIYHLLQNDMDHSQLQAKIPVENLFDINLAFMELKKLGLMQSTDFIPEVAFLSETLSIHRISGGELECI